MFDTDPAVPASALTDGELMQQLQSLHRTRNETLRHGSEQALDHHNDRLTEMETEYLRRFPEREVDPSRLRPDDSPETADPQR